MNRKRPKFIKDREGNLHIDGNFEFSTSEPSLDTKTNETIINVSFEFNPEIPQDVYTSHSDDEINSILANKIKEDFIKQYRNE